MGIFDSIAGGITGNIGGVDRLLYGDDPRDVYKQREGLMQKARADYGRGSILAEGAIGKGIEAQRAGYDSALQEASKASRAQRTEAKERASAAEGELLSRYGAAGKYGTTAFDQARAGISARLSREMEGIDSSLAGLMSSLQTGKGMAEMQGQGRLAGLHQDQGRFNAGLYQSLAGYVPEQPGIAGDLLGTGVGMFAGGFGT